MTANTLHAFLNSSAAARPQTAGLVRLIQSLADGAARMRGCLREHGTQRTASVALRNADGDTQTTLDLAAEEIFSAAASGYAAHYASEEREDAADLGGTSDLALAIDPLDGSSNIDVNLTLGTIFGVWPAHATPRQSFAQSGHAMLAAGCFVYGPQLTFFVTLGKGIHGFVHSRRLGTFVALSNLKAMPERAGEFAINMSNYRHWDEPVRLYVDDCIKGATGPRERDFNMRWNASLAAETARILHRGGVFLYPADARQGYMQGRLRLLYEALPIAMLVAQAGGAATDGISPILDKAALAVHEHTPLVFGSRREVDRIARYHLEPSLIAERAPLFGTRGLFRT